MGKGINLETLAVKKPVDLHVDYERLASFEQILDLHGGTTSAEHKFDGFGTKLQVRAHKPKGASIYSLDNTRWDIQSVPEIHEDLATLPDMKAIGEIVGRATHDDFTHAEEFSAVQQRPLARADATRIASLAAEKPLELRLYDIVEFKGHDVMALPLAQRKELLRSILAKTTSVLPVDARTTADASELQTWLREAFANDAEGFVVKDLRGTYTPGKRTKDWLKLKRTATFDMIVIGLYQTPEREADGWPCANMLGGVINERTGAIETFGKITVPSRALADEVQTRLDAHLQYTWSADKPFYWQNTPKDAVHKDAAVTYSDIMMKRSGAMMRKMPFAYIKDPLANSFVIEAKCMAVSTGKETWQSCGVSEVGRGYTMRQPVFTRIRDDKRTDQATTTQQILAYAGVL